MSFLARLGVVLGLDTGEFTKGLDDSKYKLRQFEAGIKTGMAAGAAALAAATVHAVKFADSIKDISDATDVSVSTVLEVGHALQLAGGNAENAGKMLSTFNKVLGDAVMGNKEAQDNFAKLGITLKDLENMSTEDLFKKSANALGTMDDKAKATSLSISMFSKSIKGVDMAGFNNTLKEGHGLTEKQKKAFEDAARAMDVLDNATHNFEVTLVEFLGSGGASFIEFLGKGLESIQKMIRAFGELLTKFDEWNAKNSKFDEESDAWSGRVTGGAIYTNAPEGSGIGQGGGNAPPSKTKRTVTAAKDSKLDQLLKELATLKLISQEYESQLNQQAIGIQTKTDELYMTQNQAQIAQVVYELEKKRADQVAQLQDKIAVAKETGADRKVIQTLQDQIDKVNELTATYKQQFIDLTTAQQAAMQSYEGGWAASYQKYQEMAINNAEIVTQSVDALFGGMSAAITEFVRTGKLDFAEFTRSVLADMARIQAQAAMSKLLSSLIGAAFNFGVGALSTTPGISTNPEFAGPPVPAGLVRNNADGGDMMAGSPYYVGENGPELVVPNRNGTIIPNNKLGGIGGNVTNVTNNYIDAIDTKSFEDRIYGSSRAIWAANQYANKNISNSRTRS